MPWQSEMYAAVRHPSEEKVLFLRSDGRWTLPRILLKGDVWAGDADALIPAFEKRLGGRPWIFRQIRIVDDHATKRIEGIFEMTMPASGWEPPRNSRWVDRSALSNLRVKEERFRPLLDRYLSDLESATIPTLRSPWSSGGWLSEVQPWIEAEVTKLGHQVLGFEQVKQWSISTVLRVTTSGPDFYFKVSKDLPLFVNEANVTMVLARKFPAYVPAPAAIEAERQWMLFAAFDQLIPESSPVDVRRQVYARFGELQRASVSLVDDLLAGGCLDRRLAVLETQIEPLLADGAALWAVSGEEQNRLRKLVPRLVELTHRLSALGLPDTLVHGDMHLGNTACVDGRLVVFDWSDACISHPFFDLQSLKWETDEGEKQSIIDAYVAGWREYVGPDALHQAVMIAGVLTPLHHAVSYQHLVANLEPDSKSELDATADYLRRVIAGADALESS